MTGQLHILSKSLQEANHVQDVTMAQAVRTGLPALGYGYQSGARESEVAQPGRPSSSKRRNKIGARKHTFLVFTSALLLVFASSVLLESQPFREFNAEEFEALGRESSTCPLRRTLIRVDSFHHGGVYLALHTTASRVLSL